MNNDPIFRIRQLIDFTVNDLMSSLLLWRYWLYRSFINYRLNFQGTRLGFLWPNISLLLVVAVLGTIWGVILGGELGHEYYLYLICGYPVWQIISSSVNKANRGFLLNNTSSGLPFTVIVFERLSLVFIPFVVVSIFVLVAVAILTRGGYEHLVYAPLAILCLMIWCVGAILFISVLVTLRPDLSQLISAFMRLSFLATPIIWEPSRLGVYQDYLWYNPFFVPLEFARYSLSGIVYELDVIWVMPIYSISLLILGLGVFARYVNVIRFRAAT